MRRFLYLGPTIFSFALVANVLVEASAALGHNSIIKGWLSDESCASGRAVSGVYTATNPVCAKKCVKDGKRIVLIDPNHNRLLVIANRDAAVERVGDYVEISGDLDEQAGTMHIESLKLLEKGREMCYVPPKKKP
jgi:hypothetical protein